VRTTLKQGIRVILGRQDSDTEPRCQGRVEQEWSDPEWSGITLEWKRIDNKSGGITLALAHVLCLDLLSCVWLRISGGLNCYQGSQRGVV